MDRNTILLIEDDRDMVELIGTQAGELGCAIESVLEGDTGLEKALHGDYALVIIDLTLPKLGGLEICKRLRSEREDLPILILTSRSEVVDKVLGLELGADDYLTKPFVVREFVARVHALLRRRKLNHSRQSVVKDGTKSILGPLEIDSQDRTVRLNGRNIPLNDAEFNLLHFLSEHAGEVFSRDDLMEKVWKYKASQFEPTVTMYLSRLRSKIEPDPTDPRFLHTVRGVGYCFEDRGGRKK